MRAREDAKFLILLSICLGGAAAYSGWCFLLLLSSLLAFSALMVLLSARREP